MIENVPFRIRQIATTHGCPPSRKAALNHSSMKKPSTWPSSMLKKVLEGPGCAMLIQNSSDRRTKDLQQRHFGFAYCASLTSLRVFQQTARGPLRAWIIR